MDRETDASIKGIRLVFLEKKEVIRSAATPLQIYSFQSII